MAQFEILDDVEQPDSMPSTGSNGKIMPNPYNGKTYVYVDDTKMDAPKGRFQILYDAPDPTANMSTFEKVAAGAGKSVVDAGRGVGQLLRQGIEFFAPPQKSISDLVTGGRGKSFADTLGLPTQADIDEAKRLDAPLMDTGAGKVGYLGGALAQMYVPGRALTILGDAAKLPALANIGKQVVNPTTYKAATSLGALQGLIQPTASNESRVLNTAIGAGGGFAGNAIANGISRLAQPVRNALDPIAQKAVDTLRSVGVPLDAAQLTGSPVLSRIRSSFMDNPFTVGAQKEYQQAQQEAFNRAALRTIGEDSKSATSDVMGAAQRRINDVFGDVLNRNKVNVDMPFMQNLASLQAGAAAEDKKVIGNVINRIFDATDSNGQIPGQIAYGIKKDLDRMASTADTTQNYYARQVRSALMDQINGSLGAADRDVFSTARGQFRNMKQIEGAIDKEGSGVISPSRLANTLGTKANRAQSVYGQGDQTLVDLAQAGKRLLPDKLPNSGTAARMAMQVGIPLGVGVGEGAMTGDWMGGAKTAASVAAIPKLLQFAINNPATANYLANGIKPGIMRSIMLAPQEYGALGGFIRRSVPTPVNGLLPLSGEK